MVLKKTLSAGVLMLALVGAAGAADPSPCVAVGTDIPKAASISLNGAWRLKGWSTPDRGSVRTLEEVPAETISVPAKVPGCYELDLCTAGLLPDLFYANN